jgi:phoH family protein
MSHREPNYDGLLKSLDKYQKRYYDSLMQKPVTCCNAKAGSGKTVIAVMAGLQLLDKGIVDQIIYVRFPDQMVQSLGALPGDLTDKEQYYMDPFYNACEELGIQKDVVDEVYIPKNQIVLCTNITFRGINIKNAFIIMDESQNASFKDLKLVLTRLHDSCHCALIGHNSQRDNRKCEREGAFEMYIHHLTKKPFATETPLKVNYRGEISQWADALMLDEKGDYTIDT